MANTINIKINQEVNGKNKVDELSVSLKNLKETINNVQNASKAIDATALIVAADAINSAVSGMVSTMQDLAGAYQIQQQAETQLATVMRQRMDATDKDIQKIKELASAQQELGIIGDEVQLAGAQQVATFLTQRTSLETLIPAMNNLIAQQKGYNATSGDAVTIANLMGKAMQGQTAALRRVGITFNEAQEEALKFGSEEERAAMLAQIITDNVGNMNAELAKTSSGQMKQLSNTLGDIKESIGAFAQSALPFMTLFASTVTATTGILKLHIAYVRCTKAMKAYGVATKAAQLALVPLVGNARRARMAIDIFGASMKSATARAIALKIAINAFTKLSAIGLVIWGISKAVDYFSDSAEEAKEKSEDLIDAEQAYTSTGAQIKVEINKEIENLNKLVAAKKDTTDAVRELNTKYGESFGVYKTANEWIVALTKNVEKYAKMKAYAAKVESIANKIEEKRWELDTLKQQEKKYLSKEGISGDGIATPSLTYDRMAMKSAKTRRQWWGWARQGEGVIAQNWTKQKQLNEEIYAMNDVLDDAKKLADEAASEVGTIETTGAAKGAPETKAKQYKLAAKTLKEYEDNISVLNEKLKTASVDEAATINMELEYWQAKADAIRNAGKETAKQTEKVKANTEAVKEEIDVTRFSTEEGRAKLKNLKDIDEAVGALSEKMQTATADETLGYQQTINLLNKKRDALTRSRDILDNQEELDKLNNLGGKELKVKITGMGIDGLTEKIREIDSMLNDLNNPPTDGQRRMLEQQRSTYAAWRKQVAYSFDTYRRGWDAIQGTGNGITAITNAIKEDGNAWSKLTSIINGALQIYDSIAGIVGIVNNLTTASKGAAAAETGKAAATTATSVALGTEAANAGVAAASNVPLIASNKLATASYMEMAAAAYMAAHAYIPFAGFAIGSGYTASALALVKSMGVAAFANGGIVSGPTLGLMGEYPGAKSNPEIIAPLDKLRSLIEPQSGMSGEVEFKIKGRRLVGIFNKEQSYYNRM